MVHRPLYLALLLALLLFNGGCRGPAVSPPAPVSSVDLERYSGTWYELARLPMWFQRDCLQSRAEYQLLPDNRLAVVNSCPTRSGGFKQVTGIASVVDPQSNAKLSVSFDNWFSRRFPRLTSGDYWILALDPAYQTVVVGTPDRKFLWLMARAPALDDATFAALLAQAREQGFATEKLIIFNRD